MKFHKPYLLLLAVAALLLVPAGAQAQYGAYRRLSPFWTTMPECNTVIRLHNNLVSESITVTPVLYLEDGAPVQLEPVGLGPLGSHAIRVADALRALGIVGAHFGGAEFRYPTEYGGGALSAETQVNVPSKNFAYSIESFYPPVYGSVSPSSALHSLFWLPTEDSEVVFAVHNTANVPVEVNPTIEFRQRRFQLHAISLPARGFSRLRLPDDFALDGIDEKLSRTLGPVGSLILRHNGPGGALIATGWVGDETTGFSTMMTFDDPGLTQSQELYGAQILLGEQADLPEPGERLGVASVMTLKNMSDTPVRASAELYYTQDGAVGVAPLALGAMPAGAVSLVDFEQIRRSGRIPRDVSEVSVVVRHSGQPGALMGRIFGIGSDPTYGFYSRMEPTPGRARSEVHWTLENGATSLITVVNLAEQEDTIQIDLASDDGVHPLPPINLPPMGSATVNLRTLLGGSRLDGLSGGFRVNGESRDTTRIVVKNNVVSPRDRAALPFYGSNPYVLYLSIDPSGTAALDYGQQTIIYQWHQWSDWQFWPAYGAGVYSDSPGIVSVSGGGASATLTAEGVGTTTIWAEAWEPADQFGNYDRFVASKPAEGKPCKLGLAQVGTERLTATSGKVKFRVANTSCPAVQVTVGAQVTNFTGLTWSGWASDPFTNITLPTPQGGLSAEHSFTYNISDPSEGSITFQVSIINCGGGNCSPNFDRNPNNVTAGPQTHP